MRRQVYLSRSEEQEHRNMVNFFLFFLGIVFSLVWGEAMKGIILLDFRGSTFRLFDYIDTGILLSGKIRELAIISSMVFFFAAHAYVFSKLIDEMVRLELDTLRKWVRRRQPAPESSDISRSPWSPIPSSKPSIRR